MNRSLITFVLLALATAANLATAQTPVANSVIGQEVQLSLRDAILLALENNLEIQIARAAPAIAREDLLEAKGAYDPILAGSWRRADDETPIATLIPGAVVAGNESVVDESNSYSAGASGQLPLGLSYRTTYGLDKLESTSGFSSALSPRWSATWANELRVPLLEGLYRNDTDVQVIRRGLARDVSIEDFRREVSDEIQAVERSYWELRAAREGLAVAETSVAAARKLREQTQVQYEVGVVSRVAVTQAISGEAQREVDLIRARNREENAHDALLNRTLAPDAVGYTDTKIRLEEPEFLEYQLDLPAAVNRALQYRPELLAAQKRVEDSEVQLSLAKNKLLPKLDVVGRYDRAALSGRDVGAVGFSFVGSASDASGDLIDASGESAWSLTAEVEIPLFNQQARASVSRQEISYRRTLTEYRRTEQSVVLETRTAARALQSAVDGIAANERAKEAAAEALRAEQERLRVGDSTPFQVLEFEEDFAGAENGLIEAFQVYRNAITALERAQGSLLETRDISLYDELER